MSKSLIFRSLYWQPFYICKAIEYIHNRLLGRPTYGRQEINQYFDIAYKQGYNAFIDSILDSSEYMETFGNTIVPYERYTTPLGLSARTLRPSISKFVLKSQLDINISNQFITLGKPTEARTLYNVQKRIYQGVTSKRDQSIIFKYEKTLICYV